MAEWLRSGLQIRARRFDSGSGLHFCLAYAGAEDPSGSSLLFAEAKAHLTRTYYTGTVICLPPNTACQFSISETTISSAACASSDTCA